MATYTTRCEFCRRLICDGPAHSRQKTSRLEHSSLLPGDILPEEAFCRECDRFYRQLITFGRGDESAPDWTPPEPPVQALQQSGGTAGLPA